MARRECQGREELTERGRFAGLRLIFGDAPLRSVSPGILYVFSARDPHRRTGCAPPPDRSRRQLSEVHSFSRIRFCCFRIFRPDLLLPVCRIFTLYSVFCRRWPGRDENTAKNHIPAADGRCRRTAGNICLPPPDNESPCPADRAGRCRHGYGSFCRPRSQIILLSSPSASFSPPTRSMSPTSTASPPSRIEPTSVAI